MKKLKLTALGLLAGLLFTIAPSHAQNTKMMEEQNKALVQRFFTEVLNGQNTAIIDQLYIPDMIDHTAFPDQPDGVEGIKTAISYFFETFDQLKVEVEELIAENDKVATFEKWTAIDKSSGRKVEGEIMHIFKISNGKITDEWSKGWEWLEKL